MERRKAERKKRKLLYEKKIELIKKNRSRHKRLILSTTDTYVIYITSTMNNIFYNITDFQGNTKLSMSAGTSKLFTNTRKHTKAAALEIGKIFVEKLIAAKAQNFIVILRGIKYWRKKVIRLFVKRKKHFNFVAFFDDAIVPFNGCRRQKHRRL